MQGAPVSVERWRPLVSKYFPAGQVNNALAIMQHESGGNPGQHNGNILTQDDSWGLYQVNLYGNLKNSRPSPDWLQDPENNIKWAAAAYRTQGWEPWHNSGKKLGLIK